MDIAFEAMIHSRKVRKKTFAPALQLYITNSSSNVFEKKKSINQPQVKITCNNNFRLFLRVQIRQPKWRNQAIRPNKVRLPPYIVSGWKTQLINPKSDNESLAINKHPAATESAIHLSLLHSVYVYSVGFVLRACDIASRPMHRCNAGGGECIEPIPVLPPPPLSVPLALANGLLRRGAFFGGVFEELLDGWAWWGFCRR